MLHSVLFRYLTVGKNYVLKADTAMYHAAWNSNEIKWFVDERQPYKQSLVSGTVVLCLASNLIPDRRIKDRRTDNETSPVQVREIVFRDATTGSIWIYYVLDSDCGRVLPTVFDQISDDTNSDDVPTIKHLRRALRGEFDT